MRCKDSSKVHSKTYRVLTIFLLLLVFLNLIPLPVPTPTSLTSKAWWNVNWQYYKVCYIDDNGYSGYYQMRLNVSYSSGGDVSCEGHCQADFDDIRFVDIDNSTVLPYWKETYVDSQYAIFWVNVSADAMSDGKILMYYGNPSATDESNGNDVFLLYEDWEDWSGTTTNPSWSGWTVEDKDTNTAYEGDIQISTTAYTGNYAIKKINGFADVQRTGLLYQDIIVEVAVNVENYGSSGTERAITLLADDESTARLLGYYSKQSTSYYSYRVGSTWHTTSKSLYPTGEWHTYGIASTSSGSKFYVDDEEIASTSDVISVNRIKIGSFWNNDDSCVAYIDTLKVRKFAEPEPVWSGFSAEQQQSGNYAPSVSNPQPSNGETNVPITLSQLSITINDADGDIMNITWQENSSGTWKTFNTTTNVGNGTYYAYNTSWISEQDKKYWWRVCVNDGSSWTNVTYFFTTGIAIFNISVPQSDIDNYGLQYPVTYKFSIPSGMTGLKCYKRNSTNSEWWQLPEKTSKNATSPTTLYNGIEVVRFDYGNNTAYVSVGFTAGKNYMHIKFTDSEGSLLYNCSYESITMYYDNRKAAVVITWDDWNNYHDDDFVEACNIAQARNLWATVGVITHNFTDDTPLSSTVWQHIQNEVDEGCVEVASHSRTHPDIPYDDYDSEINGSKQDILNNLTLPYGQYVYAYIYPHGHEDSTAESKCGQYHYLISRDTYTGSSSTDFSSWSDTYNKYAESKPDKRMGSDGTTSLSELNSAFDSAYSSGGIYHVMSHPYKVDWNSYGKAHFDYIANHTDVWYVGYGLLYMYHYVEDRDIVTVAAAPLSETNNPPTLSNPSATPPTGVANYTIFYFNITYSDPDGDPPTEIKVNISKTGWYLNATMTYVSGDNETGALYSYSTTLSAGTYDYFFYASDGTDSVVNDPTDQVSVEAQSYSFTVSTADPSGQENFTASATMGAEWNVGASYQTSSIPAIQITNTGNVPIDISISLTSAPIGNVHIKYNTSPTPPSFTQNPYYCDKELTTTPVTVFTIGVGETGDIWLWADFENKTNPGSYTTELYISSTFGG